MAQIRLSDFWELRLHHDEMRLVALALSGKLKPDDAEEAKKLLAKMNAGRLAELSQQVSFLKQFADEEEADDPEKREPREDHSKG